MPRFTTRCAAASRWVPEVDELTHPLPVVSHEAARKRALEMYAKALKK
jgi:deoxyribodipyrimidine photo-lyase